MQEAAHPDANIIFGASFDPSLDDEIRVSVIATGFDEPGKAQAEQPAAAPAQAPAAGLYTAASTADQAAALQAAVERINREAGLHVQLVLNEPRGFSTGLAYGTFKGVGNYLVMAGRKAPDLNERVGYYGEQLVLLAWQLGLGSCWAGLTYRSVKDAYRLEPGEKVVCMIALGHPDDERRRPRRKRAEQVSNVSDLTPAWFRQGVEAAIKAPTAVRM